MFASVVKTSLSTLAMSLNRCQRGATTVQANLVSGCEVVANRSIEVGYPDFDRSGFVAKGVRDQGKPPGNGLKRLQERLTKVAPHSGFPAYVRAHFETFSKVVVSAGRNAAKWDEIAKWAQDEGLTSGRPLTAVAAKRAYEREKKRREGTPKPPNPKAAPTSDPPRSTSVRMVAEPSLPEAQTNPLDRVRKAAADTQPWNRPKKGKT